MMAIIAIRGYRTTPREVFLLAGKIHFPLMVGTNPYVYRKVRVLPDWEDAVAEYDSFGMENVIVEWRRIVPQCCSAT